MSRIGFVSTKCLILARHPLLKVFQRTFLSEAYQCKKAWEKRLESPILKKVNLQNLFQEIDYKYTESGNLSAIDADIFFNANTKTGFMEDVEDVVFKLRRSPESWKTMPSSHHAVVRLLLDAGKTKTLLKILSDKLTYGIFPDQFSLNILMDTFLKQEKFAWAARVAVLQMLEEDWENLLTTRLAVYSCHMYLKNLEQPWFFEEEIVVPEPEPKEVVKLRVRYLRKPYFDDHFDIKDPLMLVGKTLCMFSTKIGGSEQLSTSYHLLGLVLHKKWDKVMEIVDHIVESKKHLHRDALDIAKKSVEVEPEAEATSPDDSKTSKPAKPDPAKEALEAALKAEREMKQKVSNKLSELDTLTVEGDMVNEMSLLVKESVKQQEKKDIEEQEKLYAKWEEDRMAALLHHQALLKKEMALQRIQQQKKELVEKEKEIYFFDEEDKLDMMIQSKEKFINEFETKAAKVKEDKTLKDAEYVPPETFKRYS